MKVTKELQAAALAALEEGFEIVYSTRADGIIITYRLEHMLEENLGNSVHGKNTTYSSIDFVNSVAGMRFVGGFLVKGPARPFSKCLTYKEFRARVNALKGELL